MNKFNLLPFCLISTLFISSCATTTLLNKSEKTYTKNVKTLLVQDNVLAFGKPLQSLSDLSQDSLVIAGQKNSYVLTSGGDKFVKVVTALDPKFIQIEKELTFYSADNDGKFTGVLPLEYVKLSEDVSKKDREFFIENGAKECTSSSDQRLNSQRFCFTIPLKGLVYPIVTNRNTLKPLSKPYTVSIYTTREEKSTPQGQPEKLFLFPFAVAFDVVTLPFQAISKIFE